MVGERTTFTEASGEKFYGTWVGALPETDDAAPAEDEDQGEGEEDSQDSHFVCNLVD